MLTDFIKKYSLLMAALCLIVSCEVVPDYSGAKYKRTSKVDVYYSFDEVKRDYTVMGQLTGHKYPPETVKKNLSGYAEKIGADAIVITGFNAATYKENAVAIKYKVRQDSVKMVKPVK
jgi:hypothetical protein